MSYGGIGMQQCQPDVGALHVSRLRHISQPSMPRRISTCKCSSKQASRQADRRVNRQAGRYAAKHVCMHTGRH